MNKSSQTIPGGWKKKQIKDLLDYERPDKYIVESDRYIKGGTPVLTANKSFVLGYTDEKTGIYVDLPAIIFDDFTTDSKFVDFPFKIKSSAIKILKNKNDVDIRFAYEKIKSINFPTGSHKRYYISQYQDMEVVVPPITEQKKIAEILGVVDDEIQKTEEIVVTTEKLKDGLMRTLLTRGIGHTKFNKTKIGHIPEGWKIVRGEEISEVITKGASPKWQGFEYQKDGMLFVTSENVRDGVLDISSPKFLPIEFHKKLKNSQLKNGDILINIVGASIGRSCLYKSEYDFANINQAVCLMRLSSDAHADFISYFLQSQETISRLLSSQTGSARQNLSLGDIRNFLFALPPQDEQVKIASYLGAVDEKILINQKVKAKLTLLKKGLMQDLLSGKVRVI